MKTILTVLTAIVFAFGLIFVPANVSAQSSTTGTIEGTVTDSTGAVVPGITVLVSGSNLIRPQSATTNDDGVFRVSSIPPGRYTVIIEAIQGFGRYEQNNVEVNLSSSSAVNVTLSASGGTNEVTVVAGANIDQTSTTGGTNVTTEQFSNFPTQRTIQSIYTIAPTVTRSGLRDASGRDRDPSVAGSSGPENNYILDGVNTTDPAFGGSGANLPFEFVQEVEVKTGAFGAEYGLATGGIFNVVTKSGGNEFRGDVFGYYTGQNFVRETKNLPFQGSAPNGFSEADFGFDLGGPIVKDKLWFFGAFNPQRRKNFLLSQTFRSDLENEITTPFYAGKITYGINDNNTFNFSTFGDFTKLEGFLGGNGFGADPNTFRGVQETGGTNYAFRLNSTFNQNFVAEFSVGLHFQRNNVIPDQSVASAPLVTDNFAILRNGAVAGVTQTGFDSNTLGCNPPAPGNNNNLCRTGFVDYVFAPGGTLQRGFARGGFGLFQNQDRNRYEAAARLQNIFQQHTVKYGVELYRNKYDIDQRSTGPSQAFANPLGLSIPTGNNQVNGFRVTNNFSVCTTRVVAGVGTVVCPSATATAVFNTLPVASRPTGFTANATTGTITQQEALSNPFLVRLSTRVRDFELNAKTRTDIESFYVQDDIKISPTVQVNLGLRWDFQQAYGNNDVKYLSLNSFKDNLQPRIGIIYDFTGKGKGKIFGNYARYVETPIPLDVNVRAGSEDSQTDKNFNINRYGGVGGSTIVPGISAFATGAGGVINLAGTNGASNLGAHPTPIDFDLKPQTVNELNIGFEYELTRDLVMGVRGIYRAQGSVIEDGSFDDGENYFLFNPGESQTERLACANPDVGCFGRARRYYRALEFTATRRFNNNFSFITSYVFSSLTGNYEGLFRNDNGQSDPNITSLFDLVSLLGNSYGRLPNDRPHQFKFNGNYTTPFKLVVSGNFYIQSGTPFTRLTSHPVYGDNEGFGDPRGTSIIPNVETVQGLANGNQGIRSAIGGNRTPTTFNLDMGVYYPIAFGEKRELRLMADFFNVLNVQRAISVSQTSVNNSGITGVAAIPNPFFGTGTVFQYPASVRIGAKFRF